jgi:hypothetical protein
MSWIKTRTHQYLLFVWCVLLTWVRLITQVLRGQFSSFAKRVSLPSDKRDSKLLDHSTGLTKLTAAWITLQK